MSYIRFTNDGWYARYDDGLTAENMVRVADGCGAYWADRNPGATVYVGVDTRQGARMYGELVASTLASWGLKARLSETICPMPALNWAVRENPEAVGGLMVTADHRSADYLGLRVRDNRGSAASAETMEQIRNLIGSETPMPRASFEEVDLVGPFMEAMAASVDGEAIAEAGLCCVVDPMYGTARGLASRLLRDLGVDVVEIHGEAREDFGGIHPEVVEPWVDDCEHGVRESGASIGVALDGPSNRAITIDEKGRPVPPSKQHALIMEHLVRHRGLTGLVVVPRSASAVIHRQAESLGLEMVRVLHGATWSYGEVEREEVLSAGDGLGGLRIPSIDPDRDGFVTMLLMVELLAMADKPLSQLVDELDEKIGTLEYGQRDMRLDAARVQVLRNLLPGLNPADFFPMEPVSVSHADGLHVEFPDGSWVLVRPSASEPLVRIHAESPTRLGRDALLDRACSLIGGGPTSLH